MANRHTHFRGKDESTEGDAENNFQSKDLYKGWVDNIIQPSEHMYEGHGVAKPSVFFTAGSAGFIDNVENILNDRGGKTLF